jgi:hypothetical protein
MLNVLLSPKMKCKRKRKLFYFLKFCYKILQINVVGVTSHLVLFCFEVLAMRRARIIFFGRLNLLSGANTYYIGTTSEFTTTTTAL